AMGFEYGVEELAPAVQGGLGDDDEHAASGIEIAEAAKAFNARKVQMCCQRFTGICEVLKLCRQSTLREGAVEFAGLDLPVREAPRKQPHCGASPFELHPQGNGFFFEVGTGFIRKDSPRLRH